MKSAEAIAATLAAKLDVIRARGVVTDPTTRLPQACGLTLGSTVAEILATARMLHANAQRAIALQKESNPRYGLRKAEKAARLVERLAERSARKAAAEEQRVARREATAARRAQRAAEQADYEARKAEALAAGRTRVCNPDRLAGLSEDARRFNLARVEMGVQLRRDNKGRVLGGGGLIYPEHLDGMDVATVRAELTRSNRLHLPTPPAAVPAATTVTEAPRARASSPRLLLSRSPRPPRIGSPRA